MSSVVTATCVNDATWQTNTTSTMPSFVSTHLRLLGTWLVSLHLRLLGTWLACLHLGGNISHNGVFWMSPDWLLRFWFTSSLCLLVITLSSLVMTRCQGLVEFVESRTLLRSPGNPVVLDTLHTLLKESKHTNYFKIT